MDWFYTQELRRVIRGEKDCFWTETDQETFFISPFRLLFLLFF
jgi:hypothetical protein